MQDVEVNYGIHYSTAVENLLSSKKKKKIVDDDQKFRIVVFSSGVDSDSETKIEEVVKELKTNEKFPYFYSEEDLQECQMLSTICHITKGHLYHKFCHFSFFSLQN